MNLPLGTAGTQLSRPRCRTAITRYRMLNKHAASWIALSSDRPLDTHLWVTFVQPGAKMQHTFRLYRNHYTHASPILRTHRCCASVPGWPRNHMR
jgi:hypothetical protein